MVMHHTCKILSSSGKSIECYDRIISKTSTWWLLGNYRFRCVVIAHISPKSVCVKII